MSVRASLLIEDRIRVPATAFDHAGYRAWVTSEDYPDGIRTTYVAGEVLIEMSPESIEAHHKVKTAVTAALHAYVMAGELGEAYADGVLITNQAAGVSSEPDFSFVSWASFESDRVRLQRRVNDDTDYIELVGSPDLVVEIVSDSSVRKDTKLLRRAYLQAGIREYWLIDVRRGQQRFEILSNAGDDWRASGLLGSGQESGVLGTRWTLSRGQNRAGRATYTLTAT